MRPRLHAAAARVLSAVGFHCALCACGARPTLAATSGAALRAALNAPDGAQNPVGGEMCASIMARYTAVRPIVKPDRNMPAELKAGYTMNGTIPIGDFFVDDTIGGQGSHYKYRAEDMKYMIDGAERALRSGGARGRRNEAWVVQALAGLELSGKRVVVFGSMEPWYESMAIAAGAASVTTVEYNRLTYEHPKITNVMPRDLAASDQHQHQKFDVALSISSFDHDGLGRYGDPLDPDGDLRAMRMAACLLAQDGALVLTVPVGPDVVVWNLHRRYGPRRLPLMLDEAVWRAESVHGWDGAKLRAERNWRQSYEPVFVLRKRAAAGVCEAAAASDDVQPTKAAWPELKGAAAGVAVETIRAQRPDVAIQKLREGEAATMDFNEKRVRVIVGPDNLVVEAPQLG